MFQVTLSDGTRFYPASLVCQEGETCTSGLISQGGLYNGQVVVTVATFPENAELTEAFGAGFALVVTAYMVGWAVGRVLKAVENF